MSNKRLITGKGGAEYYTALSLSKQLNVSIANSPSFENLKTFNNLFIQSHTTEHVINFKKSVDTATEELRTNYIPTNVSSLRISSDSEGAVGQRGDIMLVDNNGNDIRGLSLKHNNTEKGSFRYHPTQRVSKITGKEYHVTSKNTLNELWNNLYSSPNMLCRNRKDLPFIIEELAETEVSEVFWSLDKNRKEFEHHFSSLAFGKHPDLIELTFQKKANNEYQYKIETDFPTLKNIELPFIKSSGDKVVSKTIRFPVTTSDNKNLYVDIRIKNGNRYTHYNNGTPRPFIKTSITRKEIQ